MRGHAERLRVSFQGKSSPPSPLGGESAALWRISPVINSKEPTGERHTWRNRAPAEMKASSALRKNLCSPPRRKKPKIGPAPAFSDWNARKEAITHLGCGMSGADFLVVWSQTMEARPRRHRRPNPITVALRPLLVARAAVHAIADPIVFEVRGSWPSWRRVRFAPLIRLANVPQSQFSVGNGGRNEADETTLNLTRPNAARAMPVGLFYRPGATA